MKTTTIAQICAFLAAQPAYAYPSLLENLNAPSPRADAKDPPFDAASQLVSTSGIHKFVAPGPHDARGPCPGLNAMANHGYLPHSGFATILQLNDAAHKVFGMGNDLGTVLAAYGGAFDGAGAAWSIGGGFHTGIGGSHNNYETDSSPLRGDLYQYGSNSDLVMSQFRALYDMQPDHATANYDLDVLKKFRKARFDESIQKNPYFYYGPFSGAVVSQAAFIFIYRLMGNKSAEFPNGVTNKHVLKSFMSIYGPEDDLKWVPGHERIPDNWYTRNKADSYSLSKSIGPDIGFMSQGQPEISTPGCNTGKVNTFTPIDVTQMTGGKFTIKDVLANPLCFGFGFANTIANRIEIVNFVVQELVLPLQNVLGCKTVPSLNMSVAKACPGYSLYGGPNAKVAPGAIQS